MDADTDALVDPARVLDFCAQVLDDVGERVARVRPEQLSWPTGCADWDVRALLNHMTYENLGHAALAEGGHTMPTPDAVTDYLGTDHVAAFRDSAVRVRVALAAPGVLTRRYGPQQAPGSFIVQMLINEQLTHGWDLARATGQSTDLAPAAAERAIDAARFFYRDVPRNAATYQPEQPVPPGVTAADRLAAFMGRSVG
jgi:uncharacterized protein (TIGR03086 family)